jgi:hypothetical protein
MFVIGHVDGAPFLSAADWAAIDPARLRTVYGCGVAGNVIVLGLTPAIQRPHFRGVTVAFNWHHGVLLSAKPCTFDALALSNSPVINQKQLGDPRALSKDEINAAHGMRKTEILVKKGEHMRQVICLALVLLMMMHLGPTVFGADNVTSQIAAIPMGANIEVRLYNKLTLRGARGEVSSSGFILSNPGTGDRQLAFDDVISVKQLSKKSHTTRNVLIVVGIGVVVAAAVVAIQVKNCPLGCNTHF